MRRRSHQVSFLPLFVLNVVPSLSIPSYPRYLATLFSTSPFVLLFSFHNRRVASSSPSSSLLIFDVLLSQLLSFPSIQSYRSSCLLPLLPPLTCLFSSFISLLDPTHAPLHLFSCFLLDNPVSLASLPFLYPSTPAYFSRSVSPLSWSMHACYA